VEVAARSLRRLHSLAVLHRLVEFGGQEARGWACVRRLKCGHSTFFGLE